MFHSKPLTINVHACVFMRDNKLHKILVKNTSFIQICERRLSLLYVGISLTSRVVWQLLKLWAMNLSIVSTNGGDDTY